MRGLDESDGSEAREASVLRVRDGFFKGKWLRMYGS